MTKELFGIILAGGSGSRLWPLSREFYPKQFLNFSKDKTLLQATYQRLSQFAGPENILTIANQKHASCINFQLSEIENTTEHKVIGEPLSKNTAPALALGICFIQKHLNEGNDPIIIVAPSDHLINDDKSFKEAVFEGAELAKQGYIVTFGIKPSSPETGYGYIKVLPDEKPGRTGFKTDCFKEKPDYETAVTYVESGEYYWNSGIFMFSLSTIIGEFEEKKPEIIDKIKSISFEDPELCAAIYEQLPSISIDYAIMERSDKIVLIPAEFDWNDLGSWEAIYEVSAKNNEGNVIKGDVIDINCENSLIYSSSRCVSTIGIRDMIVAETDDAVLVCNRKDSQRVKESFDILKMRESDLYKHHKTIAEDWGSITALVKDSGRVINSISIHVDKELELDSDDRSLKHYYVTRGTALFKMEEGVKIVNMGQSLDAKDEPLYSIVNTGSDELEIVEITRF